MLFRSVLCIFVLFGLPHFALADHGPKKMWKRQIQPYFTAHKTGKMGPFSIHVHSHGQEKTISLPVSKNTAFDKIFKDRVNLAAILRDKGAVTYTRFNKKRGIDANTLLHGMSMSKTALAAAVGSLNCSGQIKSLRDPMGTYSTILTGTPYANVSIKNVLQMNSGVSPLNDGGKKKANRMAMGLAEFEGKADLVAAVNLFNKTLRKQGAQHNYHTADPFALSVLITEITGKPASQVFYENVYTKFAKGGQIHWAADKKGYTVSQARLVMKAADWSDFGQYILDEIKAGSCLGNFFEEGRKNAVSTKRKNVKYGYQFWVYKINGESVITMTGHGGFFNILSQKKNKVLSIFSVDENYKAGNLFSNLPKIVSSVMK